MAQARGTAEIVETDEARLPLNLVKVFSYLDENATHHEDKKVWRGYVKDLAKDLSLSSTEASRQIAALSSLGCIKRLRHGSSNSRTIYQILKEPEVKEYRESQELNWLEGALRMPSRYQRLQDSQTRLTAKVRELEDRLSRLERERGYNVR